MAEPRPLPPIDHLREVLDYDPATGVLTWTVTRGAGRAGAEAGNWAGRGRRQVEVFGRRLWVSRVCYALGTGADPYPLTIDHINRDRGDNRLANLRPATQTEQQANRGRCPQRPVRVTYPDGGAWCAPARARSPTCWGAIAVLFSMPWPDPRGPSWHPAQGLAGGCRVASPCVTNCNSVGGGLDTGAVLCHT
jgi:hypothetical protein